VLVGRPALLHWWHTDPDHTAHTFGLGSRQTVQSLRENDRWLAALHHRLHSLGLAEQTDVLLTSDHGFSTAGVPQGFEQGLLDAGWREAPHGEDLVTTGQGGGSIYLHRRAYDGAPRLVRWLQAQPWIGAIFARDDGPAAGVEGTLPLSAAWNGRLGPRAPDVKFSPGWTEEANAAGVPGTALAGNGRGASHGSASPYDMRNALFAWGPRFAQRVRSTTPAGIVDVAPTVRHLLGLPQLPADGRVLTEALDGQPDTAAAAFSEETHQASATWPGGRFQQRLFLARVGTTTYLRRVEADHH
jgi:arylsulfatase A-like enzyme